MDWGLGIVIIIGLLIIMLIAMSIYLELRLSREQERPLDILKKRYARGELSLEDFRRMKKDLHEG